MIITFDRSSSRRVSTKWTRPLQTDPRQGELWYESTTLVLSLHYRSATGVHPRRPETARAAEKQTLALVLVKCLFCLRTRNERRGVAARTLLTRAGLTFRLLLSLAVAQRAGKKQFCPSWSMPTVPNRTGQAPPG